jgi:hypothetical protein
VAGGLLSNTELSGATNGTYGYWRDNKLLKCLYGCRVEDPHLLDTVPDPDPACHFVADPDPDPDPTFQFDPDHSFQIRAQNLEKVVK